FAVEDRDADAVAGEEIGVAVGDAVDESVQAQAAQVVAHLAGAVGVLVEVSGDEPAKAFVGKAAGDGVQDVAEGAGQSHGALIPEAQRSGSLALMVGLVDALKERRADGTALAGTLDHKQSLVDAAGLGDELGQVLQAREHADVGWLVDDGFDSQRAAALEVLLDARMLVAEVDPDLGAGREHARPERLAGGRADLAGEHERDLFGAPDADVVGDQRFEERRPELGVQDVEVVDPDAPLLAKEVKADGLRVHGPVAARQDPLELLAGDNRDNAEAALAFGALQVRADVIELAVVPARPIGLFELKDRNSAVGRERPDLATEPVADRAQQRRRGNLMPKMPAQEPHDLATDLQARQVCVEIEPIDALDFKR